MKCQWKVLTNASGKRKDSAEIFEKSPNHLYPLTDHTPENHGSVSLVSSAIFTDTRQSENLSGDKAILSPTVCLQQQFTATTGRWGAHSTTSLNPHLLAPVEMHNW